MARKASRHARRNAGPNRWYIGKSVRQCMVWCNSYEEAIAAREKLAAIFSNVCIYNVHDNGEPCDVYYGA